jgi:hypothetical protein
LAILADPGLTERQKQSLLDVYESFRALTQAADEHRLAATPSDPLAEVAPERHHPRGE